MALLFNLVVLAKTIGHPGLLFPSHPIFYIISGPVGSAINVVNPNTSHPLSGPSSSHLEDCPKPPASSLCSQAHPVVHGTAPISNCATNCPVSKCSSLPPGPSATPAPFGTFSTRQPAQPRDNADQTVSPPFFSPLAAFPHSRGLGSRPWSSSCLLLPYLSSRSDHIGVSCSMNTRSPFLLQGISTAVPAAEGCFLPQTFASSCLYFVQETSPSRSVKMLLHP